MKLWRRGVDGSAYMDTVKDLGRIPDKPFRQPLRRCGNCAWFNPAPERQEQAHDTHVVCCIRYTVSTCRRHAPIAVSPDGLTDLGWPMVNPTDYCGDWEAK